MTEQEKIVLQLISEKGPIKSTQIAEQLHIDLKSVTNIIQLMRRHFRAGKLDNYIYTSKDGYTLDESKRSVVYETNMRLAQMVGMAVNSNYIRQRCKKIAISEFRKLAVVYRPSVLMLERELK